MKRVENRGFEPLLFSGITCPFPMWRRDRSPWCGAVALSTLYKVIPTPFIALFCSMKSKTASSSALHARHACSFIPYGDSGSVWKWEQRIRTSIYLPFPDGGIPFPWKSPILTDWRALSNTLNKNNTLFWYFLGRKIITNNNYNLSNIHVVIQEGTL